MNIITLADIYPEQPSSAPNLIGQGSVVLLGNNKEPYVLARANNKYVAFVSLVNGDRWVNAIPVDDPLALTRAEVAVAINLAINKVTFDRIRYIGEARDVIRVFAAPEIMMRD